MISLKKKTKVLLKTYLICALCCAFFVLTGYIYLEFPEEKVDNQVPSVPYYSYTPDSAGVLFDISGNLVFTFLDFERESISLVFCEENYSYEDEIYGYTVDYTITADHNLIGGIVDLLDGIELEKEGEKLSFMGSQVVAELTTTTNSEEKRYIIKQIISKIAQKGLGKKDFLYIIENSETNLTVPDCYYWSDSIKAVCKTVVIVN